MYFTYYVFYCMLHVSYRTGTVIYTVNTTSSVYSIRYSSGYSITVRKTFSRSTSKIGTPPTLPESPV